MRERFVKKGVGKIEESSRRLKRESKRTRRKLRNTKGKERFTIGLIQHAFAGRIPNEFFESQSLRKGKLLSWPYRDRQPIN